MAHWPKRWVRVRPQSKILDSRDGIDTSEDPLKIEIEIDLQVQSGNADNAEDDLLMSNDITSDEDSRDGDGGAFETAVVLLQVRRFELWK